MNFLPLVLLFTLLESTASVFVQRGVHFYTHELLRYTNRDNLWLAFAMGLLYVPGALVSHSLAHRLGERRMLLLILIAQMGCQIAMATQHEGLWLLGSAIFFSTLNGAKWPIVESYISAGRTPAGTTRALGWFNLTWSLAVPVALAAVGPLIELSTSMLFYVGLGCHVLAAMLIAGLTARPVHLPDDHPERPSQQQMRTYEALLSSSRMSMLASYGMMFLLTPLLPDIFRHRLGLPLAIATSLAGGADFIRFISFGVLQRWTKWHGRSDALALASLCTPLGVLLILFGPNLPVVILGQVVLGIAAGMAYYAALYYAMVTTNASVEAGGYHEAMIGSGFFIGPGIGLLGAGLAPYFGGESSGLLAAILPAALLLTVLSLRPLLALRGQQATSLPAADATDA